VENQGLMSDKVEVTTVAVGEATIELVEGDIVKESTDAIVNAANSSLMGGGGVDGAIHRAAGPDLLAETRTLGGCETGNAKISGGYRLPAKHVIHAVGPIYRRNDPTVADLLASAYRRSLELAHEHGLESIAFPAISTGIYGYPMADAARIALTTVIEFVRQETSLRRVRFVLFTPDALHTFGQVLGNLMEQHDDVRRS
jgi:O-acetyl-ADP-ribose deacetylase (regulator of RNase III)